jgi:secreted PhoX family phosphatase
MIPRYAPTLLQLTKNDDDPCVMTNNNQRTATEVNGPNPRPNNIHGHIIELTESGDDAAATTWLIVSFGDEGGAGR